MKRVFASVAGEGVLLLGLTSTSAQLSDSVPHARLRAGRVTRDTAEYRIQRSYKIGIRVHSAALHTSSVQKWLATPR